MLSRGAWLRWATGISLLVVLWTFSPPSEPRIPLCGFRWLTGLPCPLCGMTRAMFALAKGHWSQAVHLNALSPLGFVMLGSLFFESTWRGRLWSWGVGAFAVYGVWRVVLA